MTNLETIRYEIAKLESQKVRLASESLDMTSGRFPEKLRLERDNRIEQSLAALRHQERLLCSQAAATMAGKVTLRFCAPCKA